MNDSAPGRRPIKSRDMRLFQRLAAWLASTSVSPNMISTASMGFALLAGVAMACTPIVENDLIVRLLWILGILGIQGRLIANLLDGMVAVEGGKASPVGDLYNEVPDRVSDSIIFIGAGLAAGGRLDIGLAAALVAVFVAYVRAIGASVSAGQVFLGPMAKPQRMALMTLTCLLMACLPQNWQWSYESYGLGIVSIALLMITAGGLLTSVFRLRKIASTMREYAAKQEAEHA